MKRDAMIRDLRRGSITTKCNNTSAALARLVEYAKGAGKRYKELHVSDDQMEAITQDKLRWEANMGHNQAFEHGPDAPYYKGIKLLPQTPAKLKAYVEAHLPEA